MSKILTIVIPAYNAQETIIATLLSLDYQFGKYFNVLIIDDGSTKPLQPYLQPWLDRCPQIIKLIRVKNNNWGGCVNYATQHVKTKFLKILDSDDVIFTNHMHSYLQHLHYLAKANVDVVITSFAINDLKTNHLMKRHYNLKKKIVYSDFDTLQFAKVLTMHALTWNVSLLKKMRPLPVKKPYTDSLLVFQTILHSKNIALLPRNIFTYKYNFGDSNQSTSWNKIVKNLSSLKYVYHEMLHQLARNLSVKRTKSLINSVKQMLYLIILIISLDTSIYKWQRKKQINNELSFMQSYVKDKRLLKKIQSGYLHIINRRSIPFIMRLNKLILLTSQVGFIKMIKVQYKNSKYEEIWN